MADLHEEIRKLAVLIAEQAAEAFPDDLEAQRELVRGATRLAPAFLRAKVDRDDFASRPKW